MTTFTISDQQSNDSGLTFAEAVGRIADWFRDLDEWQDGHGDDELHAAIAQAISSVEQPQAGGERELQRFADAICNAVADALGHEAFHGHGSYCVSAAEQAGMSLTVEMDEEE